MSLEFSSLQKAIHMLNRSLKVLDMDVMFQSEDIAETIRAGVIQHFEVTYELCWKFIQRWLKENQPSIEAEYPRTRKELFRLAAEKNLIADPVAWFRYGEARNLTSHTYDQDEALKITDIAGVFVKDAEYLLARLKESA